MNVIALTFDRLHLSFLGCYGNSWIETPNFDRLAAQAIVGDRHYAHTTQPAENLARCWAPEFFDTLAQQGIDVRRLAEADSLASTAASIAGDAAAWQYVRGADGINLKHQETPFARLVDAAIATLPQTGGDTSTDNERSWLLWAHSAGVPELWIPPEPFASLYFDEVFDTEEAEDSAQVPRGALLQAVDQLLHALHAADAPPDLAMQLEDSDWQLLRAVYAGYVTLLDFQLGRLLDAVSSAAASAPILLIVTAANGTSLGEQRIRGRRRVPFPEELIHTPLFLTLTGRAGESPRYSGFSQPADVPATILDALGISPSERSGDAHSLLPLVTGQGRIKPREEILLSDPAGNRGLLDRHYAYHRPALVDETKPRHLYLQPEDIWHVNDVAKQNPDVVKRLDQRLTTD